MADQNYDFNIIDDEEFNFTDKSISDATDNSVELTLDTDTDKDKDKDKAPEKEAPEIELDEDKKPETDDDIVEDDTYQKIAENLVEMGIFTLDEGEEAIEVKTSEALQERFQKDAQKIVNHYHTQKISQFGPEYAEAWDVIFEKGLNPYEYFSRQKEIDSYEEMDLTKEDTQKQIFRDFYARQGFTPERIEEKLQKSIDYDDLEKDTKEMHETLVGVQKQQLAQRAQQIEQQRIQAEQDHQAYQQQVLSVLTEKVKQKELDGIPLNTKKAQETLDFMFQPRYTLTTTGEHITELDKFIMELKNPANTELALKVALLAQSGFKMDGIKKAAVSTAGNKLFDNLVKKDKIEKRSSPVNTKDLFPFS